MFIQKIKIHFLDLTEEYFDGSIKIKDGIYVLDKANNEEVKLSLQNCTVKGGSVTFYREYQSYKSNEVQVTVVGNRINNEYCINLEKKNNGYLHKIEITI